MIKIISAIGWIASTEQEALELSKEVFARIPGEDNEKLDYINTKIVKGITIKLNDVKGYVN